MYSCEVICRFIFMSLVHIKHDTIFLVCNYEWLQGQLCFTKMWQCVKSMWPFNPCEWYSKASLVHSLTDLTLENHLRYSINLHNNIISCILIHSDTARHIVNILNLNLQPWSWVLLVVWLILGFNWILLKSTCILENLLFWLKGHSSCPKVGFTVFVNVLLMYWYFMFYFRTR